MKLQTQIPLKPVSQNTIDYNSKIVLFGSCFSEHIGGKFVYSKFNTFSNPFGILFHVKAIESLIEKSISEYKYSEKEIFELNEQFQCFDAHSKLNGLKSSDLVSNLNSKLEQTKHQLETATHVIITLGTSWVYKHKSSTKIVANCHKAPQHQFDKILLSAEEISQSLQNCITHIQSINSNVQFVFTVSPVRHIKDGFVENTISKAHLISGIHSVVNLIKNTSYFPSYEIVMDELRDYRFYNDDMLHPNKIAINYIWECFLDVWISNATQVIIKDVEVIQKGLNHKPFNENSLAHKKFLSDLELKKASLKEKHSITF
ncbi:GSCFA domain-containing protein [Aurantibacter sp.]|uniref:GSCFA domain-containing protein n=1 Tax=Aurantibacter sp. TaxID=2807103 RepID=UPI0035C842DD